MTTEINKVDATEVMAAGGEIVKMTADEQKIAYGFLLGLLARDTTQKVENAS